MGAVWLARDEVLDTEVALKRIGLLPGADGVDLARAQREAQLSARLNHPHVVAVLNLVVDADTDAWWLVMEYVDGSTLAELVRQEGRLSPDDAAPLMWQTADALVAAHAEGIVHRDVKPSNILVDGSRCVKLTDFGIARIATDPSLTRTGLVTGSPAYLAPEVAAGHRGDEAVDVWSLGATLFHLLSGRLPYESGDHVLGGLYRIVNEEPPRLTDAGWLTPLLEATLVKDPARRWSMAQVRDYLGGDREGPGSPAPIGAASAQGAEETATIQLPGVGGHAGASSTAKASAAALVPRRLSGRAKYVSFLGAALVVLLVLAVLAVLDREPTADSPAAAPSSTASSPAPSAGAGASQPTAEGMEAFVRDYVAAVATDPDAAWDMLTPKFQRESGGLDAYREFWGGVGAGRVLEISADPTTLVVSYRVRFENFGTGRRPTVLELVFDGDRYLIDGERTAGFVPAG